MTDHPSDYVHDAADERAANPKNRYDRVATYARFTPLDPGFQALAAGRGDVDVVHVVGRVRVSCRWTGSDSPRPGNLLVITVDDQTAGAPLLAHMLWRVETAAFVHDEHLDAAVWHQATDHVANIDTALMAPHGIELTGWSLPVGAVYGESWWSTEPPSWVTALGAATS